MMHVMKSAFHSNYNMILVHEIGFRDVNTTTCGVIVFKSIGGDAMMRYTITIYTLYHATHLHVPNLAHTA